VSRSTVLAARSKSAGTRPELLERQFLGADILRAGLFLQPLLEEGVDLLLIDETARHRAQQRKAGDFGELAGNLGDLPARGLVGRTAVRPHGRGGTKQQPQCRQQRDTGAP